MSNVDVNLENVVLSYGQKFIFQNLSLTFSKVGISFIIGENGAGKTQLLRLVHGLGSPCSGKIIAPRTKNQAMLQQAPTLLARSVKKNIDFIRGTSVCPASYFDTHYAAVIQRFRLKELLNQLASNLSGGQKKRVALARLFLQKADLYLLDEPAANVDHQSNLLIESVIGELLVSGKKVLIATHDYGQMLRLFQEGRDEILCIKNGRLNARLEQLDIYQLQNYF